MNDLKAAAVTGATGFVAEKLVEQLLLQGVKVHAIARNEGKLIALKNRFPEVEIFPCAVQEYHSLKRACHGCQGVFHLAALKDVALAESHPSQAVRSNIIGSENVLKLSIEEKMKFVVTTSTDKASRISGVYGASKFIVERMFMEYESFYPECKYRVIRFGNVFHSTGSVLDVWKRQLENKSEIELTHPDCTRFFWTRKEAVSELLQVLDRAKSAKPYLPNLRAVRIGMLMDIMLETYGNGESSFREIGLREGENKHEQLGHGTSSEHASKWTYEELKEILGHYAA